MHLKEWGLYFQRYVEMSLVIHCEIQGYASGVLSALVSQPADNMVSQINNLKREGSFWTKMKIIYSGDSQKEGIGFKGLWKGLGPRIILVGTLTGIQWY